MFQVKAQILPHPGIIPGARGHKKITIPAGTKVYCIMHGARIFWAAYMSEAEAQEVANSLQATVTPGATKRYIELYTLLAWNFKIEVIPTRISRPKS